MMSSLVKLPDLWHGRLDDGGGLVAHADDVPGGEDEAVLAGVGQLHRVAELDPRPALRPVVTAARTTSRCITYYLSYARNNILTVT